MKRQFIVFLSLASAAVAQQTEAPKPLTVGFGNGTVIELHTVSTRTGSPLSTSGAVEVGAGHDAHRFVEDKDGRILFGYYFEARKLDAGTYSLRIKPFDREKLRQQSEYLRQKFKADVPTLAGARDFPPLAVGDQVQIDILYNPATGEKLYDVLKVAGERALSNQATTNPPGERFSLLKFRVDIDGKTARETHDTWMTGGGLLIYLPGRGDFYLGLSPCTGVPCKPAGWADHNILRFHAGSELVEVVAGSNVLQNSDYRTIWVYHDPQSEARAAKGQSVDFTCGDSVEQLIRFRKPNGN